MNYAIVKIYVKGFAIFFPLFLMIRFVFNQYLFSIEEGFLDLILHAVLMASFFSLIIISSHLWALKKAGVTQFDEQSLALKQQKTITSQLKMDEIVELIRKDVHFIISKLDFGKDKISFVSWGYGSGKHIIEIVKISSDADEMHYSILSRPLFKLSLLDYGSNFKNITQLEKLLIQ